MIDCFLGLEEVHSSDALMWVEQENSKTEDVLAKTECFNQVYEEASSAFSNYKQIAYPFKLGEYFYNFWQDEQNPKGILRRTAFEKYKLDEVQWETVIDIDLLGAVENITWFFHGSVELYPNTEY